MAAYSPLRCPGAISGGPCWGRVANRRRPDHTPPGGRITQALHVSIHPSVTIGSALFIDHGTGITIGEGVVIGEDVSMLQEVTLSSSPEGQAGAPRIGRGVLLSAGATVLGNVDIGDFAKIGAGSLVLASVPSGYTAVGVPARLVGRASDARPALNMDQSLP